MAGLSLRTLLVTTVLLSQYIAARYIGYPYGYPGYPRRYGCGCNDPCDPCQKKEKEPEGYLYGSCYIQPNPSNPDLTERLSGNVYFRQKASGGDTMFKIDIDGFDTSDGNIYHGFHVHMYGNVESACEDAAGHYNPEGQTHGAPSDTVRHVGDLGNIKEGPGGSVQKDGVDKVISLSGEQSILGRSIVVHAMRDDLGQGGDEGSLTTGNAGARLACCTIAATDGSAWA